MKLSEVSTAQVKAFCGITDDDDILPIITDAAKSYIYTFTGRSGKELDSYDDVAVAYLVLVNHMYTNRDFAADKAAENPVVAQILGSHRDNLLGVI